MGGLSSRAGGPKFVWLCIVLGFWCWPKLVMPEPIRCWSRLQRGRVLSRPSENRSTPHALSSYIKRPFTFETSGSHICQLHCLQHPICSYHFVTPGLQNLSPLHREVAVWKTPGSTSHELVELFRLKLAASSAIAGRAAGTTAKYGGRAPGIADR